MGSDRRGIGDAGELDKYCREGPVPDTWRTLRGDIVAYLSEFPAIQSNRNGAPDGHSGVFVPDPEPAGLFHTSCSDCGSDPVLFPY